MEVYGFDAAYIRHNTRKQQTNAQSYFKNKGVPIGMTTFRDLLCTEKVLLWHLEQLLSLLRECTGLELGVFRRYRQRRCFNSVIMPGCCSTV